MSEPALNPSWQIWGRDRAFFRGKQPGVIIADEIRDSLLSYHSRQLLSIILIRDIKRPVDSGSSRQFFECGVGVFPRICQLPIRYLLCSEIALNNANSAA